MILIEGGLVLRREGKFAFADVANFMQFSTSLLFQTSDSLRLQ